MALGDFTYWEGIDLVIFDMDGTLYDQNQMRTYMFMQILGSRDLDILMTIRAFRKTREVLAGESNDFRTRQYEITASIRRCSVAHVRQVVEEWIEKRPLPFLYRCKFDGVDQLFHALRASGKRIAVFSDYPVQAKLTALGLGADILVSACDERVCRLKPNPAGLQRILEISGVSAMTALMIGDRVDKDWEAARLIGMRALIRSRRRRAHVDTFQSFNNDSAFLGLFTTSA